MNAVFAGKNCELVAQGIFHPLAGKHSMNCASLAILYFLTMKKLTVVFVRKNWDLENIPQILCGIATYHIARIVTTTDKDNITSVGKDNGKLKGINLLVL